VSEGGRGLLPSEQYRFEGIPQLDEATLHERRQLVFLVLSGLFLGTLAMLNILGVTRFIDLSFELPGTNLTIPMPLAVGVLPYPVTFLCTDFISELYGRHRANQVVWMGLALNLWVMFILWTGGALAQCGRGGRVYASAQAHHKSLRACFSKLGEHPTCDLIC